MIYKIFILETAIKDLEEIYDYLYNSTLEREVANKITNHIKEAIQTLNIMPYRCRNLRIENVKALDIKNYTIAFKIDEENKRVIVLRVVHSTREHYKL